MVDDPLAGDGRTMRERMLAGDLYRPDAVLSAESAQARELADALNRPGASDAERHTALVALLGKVGPGTVIRPPLYVDYGTYIEIGTGCFANFGLVALDVAPIRIGDHVQIGPNVQLLPPDHPRDPVLRRAGWESGQPITIEDNVWLGGGAIVLGGVTIGADTIVGAGAVVTRSLPAGVVAVGNPARVVRSV
jgi:maltose O-acetyltransferase